MSALASFVEMIILALSGQTGSEPEELPPFESDQRLLWAVRKGARSALGSDGAERLAAALPAATNASECASFLAGAAAGMGEAVAQAVQEQVVAIASAIKGLIAYYGLVYDLDLWRQLLSVWTAPAGTPVTPFAQFLQAEHPDLYEAIVRYAPLCAQLDALVQPLRDPAPVNGSPWKVNERAVADWLATVPLWLGREIRSVVDDVVAREGDPFAQGRIVGHAGGRVVVEAVLLALTVYDLAAATSRAAGRLVSEARVLLAEAERARVLARVSARAPALQEAAAGVAQAKSAAVRIYEELATEISPYSRLKIKTGDFNREVRETLNYSLSDVEYVKLRLDANHIVKGELHARFKADFDRLFGWKEAQDMDAIALHTEWHIRSGERLKTRLNLLGAEKERSFSYALDTHIAQWEVAHGPFQNLEQVFQAHQEFYRTYSPRLHERLEGWFSQKLAVIRGGH